MYYIIYLIGIALTTGNTHMLQLAHMTQRKFQQYYHVTLIFKTWEARESEAPGHVPSYTEKKGIIPSNF